MVPTIPPTMAAEEGVAAESLPLLLPLLLSGPSDAATMEVGATLDITAEEGVGTRGVAVEDKLVVGAGVPVGVTSAVCDPDALCFVEVAVPVEVGDSVAVAVDVAVFVG